MTNPWKDRVTPWDLMQKFDADRFGSDVFDPDERARWSRAIFIGGLPYMWSILARQVLEMIYQWAEVKEGDKVLLIGESLESCGFIKDLEEIVGAGGQVTPIDIQENARNAVTSGVRDANGKLGTFSYDKYTEDIVDEAYDIVLNLQAIQHTNDWRESGKEFLRIMKSGRRLVMAEIALGSPDQVTKYQADLHLWHLIDKIFSARGFEFMDQPYYSTEQLKQAFEALLEDMESFEWRGLDVFWGRKP